jgi:protein SCO1/2
MLSPLVVMLCIGSAACSSHEETPAASPQPQQVQRYNLTGKVVAVDKPRKKITVDHEAIPGFMGAMTMPYPVKDEHLLDNLSPGDHITAKVVSTGSEFWLDNIVTVPGGTPGKSASPEGNAPH